MAEAEQRHGSDFGLVALGRREIPFGSIYQWALRRKIEWILGFGVVARVAGYLACRSYWLDENSLRQNIVGQRFLGLFGPLSSTQLAPPGFLVVEWGAFHLMGDRPLVLRLLPMLGGVASLFLFLWLARRCLRPDAVWIALALFACSDDLIYYASELKQYSTDVAWALLCTLLAHDLSVRPASPLRLARFAVVGMVAVWFSHPVAFVLAGVGLTLIVSALVRGQWPRALVLAAISLGWLVSFVGVYLVSLEQLDHRPAMWRFWAFAFPPAPFTLQGGTDWLLRALFYVFANPFELATPLGAALSALAGAGFFAAGWVSFLRRGELQSLALLTAPGLIVLVASCLYLYPFHGRLLLFLLPGLWLLVSEGIAWICDVIGSPRVRVALLGGILLVPFVQVTYHLIEPRDNSVFNPRGDRRPPDLEPTHFPF